MGTPEYLAHIAQDGRKQTVAEHLENTAMLCAGFAAAFGAEEQGRMIGLAHDIGKCSAAFQERLRGGNIVDHASAGAYECAVQGAFWASACVAGHHGGLPDFGNQYNDLPGDATLFGRLKKAHAKGIPAYDMPGKLPLAAPPEAYGKDDLTDSGLIRMLFSCLVDADYLDTERFMSDGAVERGTGESVSALLAKLDLYTARWKDPRGELNKRRSEVLQACIESGKNPRGLYTLTVPTGGGKTVASMAFALGHAAANGMDRVIYVIPYTSIIEQTAEVFRGIFGENNVVEHHSNADYEVGENAAASDYAQIRATENWDAPIIVTTAVQFFESMYANRPSKCRKLHSVANSVILFDEAQTLPRAHLRPCVAAIAKLVKDFSSTAVLCTATQPVLNDLFEEYAPGIRIKEIVPDSGALYQALRRVVFRDLGSTNADSLARELAAQKQTLCIVNSRRSAQELFLRLPQEGRFHLSTLMYPAHRRAVLAEIRKRLRDGLPCRVVSTSLIEAGVDVDFPAVFREKAGLDSILQAAGRCNREGKRTPEESVVTIFGGISVTPALLQPNIGAANEALRGGADPSDPETVRRYFRAWRSFSDQNLDKAGVIDAFERGIQGCRLPFRTVAERFRLIDDAAKTVYVPLGAGEELAGRIRAGERSRALFRKLGQYGVSVYEKHFRALESAGCLEQMEDGSAILTDIALYDRNMGLKMPENDTGGIFV